MPRNRQMAKISIPNLIPLMELAGKTRNTHKPIHMEQAMEMLKTITKMDFRYEMLFFLTRFLTLGDLEWPRG